jgi:MFS family permease
MPLLLLFDGAWNAGNVVATNGYIMKLTPRENRTMFIASFTGLAGLAGGLSAVVAGWYLDRLTGFSVDFLGRIWNNYHVLFLASLFLRIGCAGMVHWIREPDSAKTVEILDELMDVWPMNILRFPVDLYRRHIR